MESKKRVRKVKRGSKGNRKKKAMIIT